MFDVTYWFMFPIGIIIATIAMMFGIGGAVFFSPLFFLLLKLKPDVAFGTGIVIEVFGFGSGFIGYFRKKMIDFKLGSHLLLFSIPTAIFGVVLGKVIPSLFLQLSFGIGMILLAFSFIHKDKQIIIKHHSFHKPCKGMKKNKNCYGFLNKPVIYTFSSIGGLFLGLLSSGLGEINEYIFIKKLRMHTARASGTSVYVVMVTAFVASISHLIYFSATFDHSTLLQSANILLFTIPGVIIGAQIGVRLASKINETVAKKTVFGLLLLIGVISLLAVL